MDAKAVRKSIRLFVNLKEGDRIFYTRYGHALTRRVQKINAKSVTVLEDGKAKTIGFDRIFMA